MLKTFTNMDISSIFFSIIGIALLLVCSSFFSGSETALTALTKAQIQRLRLEKRRSSAAIVRFLDNPRRLFITVLFGNTLVNMAFVSITGMLVYDNLFKGRSPGLAYVVAILVQTMLLLVFGEITPKTYAIKHSERFSRVAAQPLWFLSRIIFPFRIILRRLIDAVLPLFGVRSVVDQTPLTSAEIQAVMKTTEEYGALDREEGEMIHNIFELHDIKAIEAMIPRTEMVCIEASKTIHEAFLLTKKVGHSRLPVYTEHIDNIRGIFYVKDLTRWKGLIIKSLGNRLVEELTLEEFLSNSALLKRLNPGNENTLVRQPFFIVETQKIGILMRDMTREKQQMAILLDEFGGVSGLITVEDIVEEVLGEIFDEYDTASEMAIVPDPKDSAHFLIPGFVSLRNVNKRLKLNLDLSTADTIAGYVVGLFGLIPRKGDRVTDGKNRLEFEVLEMDGKRIALISLRLRGEKRDNNRRKKKNIFVLILVFLILFCASFIRAAEGSDGPQASGFSIFVFTSLLVISLLLLAFFAGSETAVVSASKARIEVLANQKNSRALTIRNLWQEPDKMLGIVLVGINLISAAAGVAGLWLVSYALPGKESLQELVNTVVMTLVILIFCETLPKTIFRAKADALALWSAPGLRISGFILRPVVVLITKMTNFLVRAAGRGEDEERLRCMREELKLLAKMGEEEGVLKREQLRMIHSVIDLETITIEKIMTPLIDIVALSEVASIEEFYDVVSKTGFSRIPVYKDRVDNLIGLVNVLDVLYSKTTAATIGPYIRRDVPHEPESKRVPAFLRDLKQIRKAMVFVVDEYGGVVGIVTMEDLIEEILGEIRDERDRDEEQDIHRIDDRTIECDGKAEVLPINHFYDMSIPAGDYKTIAGYIIFLTERIPKSGEIVETDKHKIVVLDADSRGVRKVRIVKKTIEH
jgi:putative hemolysin